MESETDKTFKTFVVGESATETATSSAILTNDSTRELDLKAADKLITTTQNNEKDSNKTPNNDPLGEVESLKITQLFRFADSYDLMLITFGTIGAMANGAALPLMTIIFGNIINAFLDYAFVVDSDREHLESAKKTMTDEVNKNLVYFLILGAAVIIVAYCQMAFWMLSGERQAKRIRGLYYAAIMRQDISWFDAISTGDVTSRISGDVTILQEGISEKVGSIIQYTSTFIAGFVIAFTKGK
jgi:ABC-type multidrug transport system fused ATPase/permease subunit